MSLYEQASGCVLWQFSQLKDAAHWSAHDYVSLMAEPQ